MLKCSIAHDPLSRLRYNISTSTSNFVLAFIRDKNRGQLDNGCGAVGTAVDSNT